MVKLVAIAGNPRDVELPVRSRGWMHVSSLQIVTP